jgi:CrcB protein
MARGGGGEGVRAAWIGLAGLAGALARYAVEGWVSERTRGGFPWGTLVVNATGCLLLGFVFTLLTERVLPHPTLRSALTVGFLGAYTTFSTFAFETVRLAEDGALLLAAANVVASVGAGLAAVVVGVWLGRAL